MADRLNYEHRFPGVVGGNRKKFPVIEIKDSNINVDWNPEYTLWFLGRLQLGRHHNHKDGTHNTQRYQRRQSEGWDPQQTEVPLSDKWY